MSKFSYSFPNINQVWSRALNKRLLAAFWNVQKWKFSIKYMEKKNFNIDDAAWICKNMMCGCGEKETWKVKFICLPFDFLLTSSLPPDVMDDIMDAYTVYYTSISKAFLRCLRYFFCSWSSRKDDASVPRPDQSRRIFQRILTKFIFLKGSCN